MDILNFIATIISIILTVKNYLFTKRSSDIKKQMEREKGKMELYLYINSFNEIAVKACSLQIEVRQEKGGGTYIEIYKRVLEEIERYSKVAHFFSKESQKKLKTLFNKVKQNTKVSQLDEFCKSVSKINKELFDCYYSDYAN